MSIKINEEKCIGCASCVEVCPGNLIKLNQKSDLDIAQSPEMRTQSLRKIAVIKHIRDCWGCTSCIKACPKNAISFFLGADIGGKGSTMEVSEKGTLATWTIHKYTGEDVKIVINKKDSNKY